MYVCVYTYIYIQINEEMNKLIDKQIYMPQVNQQVHIYIYIYQMETICVYICVYIYICTHTHAHVNISYLYTYMYACIDICAYIYTHIIHDINISMYGSLLDCSSNPAVWYLPSWTLMLRTSLQEF